MDVWVEGILHQDLAVSISEITFAKPRSHGAGQKSLRKTLVNYLGVPFSEHFEQPVCVTQRINGVLIIRRFDGVLKPGRDAWIRKDLFKGHIHLLRLSLRLELVAR